MMVPPLLYIMEDFEVKHKEFGVSLLKHIYVENMTVAEVRLVGICDIVWKVFLIKTIYIHLFFS